AMGLPLPTAFAVVAAPCVIAGIAVFALGAGAKRAPVGDAVAGEQA
ncbi:major facilitator transporter, partial [Burkholderia sp. TJI49]